MYHCGTKPVLMHIANGMYGAIVVEPPAGVLPKADKDYVLVASEWYLSSDGLDKPAVFNMAKAHARQPDWMTFNGYSGQYVKHPLTAKPGELVRFWVVDAGPSLDTDFHIVGTILNTAYPFGDMNPKDALHNVQTVTVPAGGGGVFDVKIDHPASTPLFHMRLQPSIRARSASSTSATSTARCPTRNGLHGHSSQPAEGTTGWRSREDDAVARVSGLERCFRRRDLLAPRPLQLLHQDLDRRGQRHGCEGAAEHAQQGAEQGHGDDDEEPRELTALPCRRQRSFQ